MAKFGALFPYIFGMILGYSTFFNVAQEVAVARESRVNVTGYRLEIAMCYAAHSHPPHPVVLDFGNGLSSQCFAISRIELFWYKIVHLAKFEI